jgi:hypothetical protein
LRFELSFGKADAKKTGAKAQKWRCGPIVAAPPFFSSFAAAVQRFLTAPLFPAC